MGQGIYFSAHSGEVTLHSGVLVGDTPRVGVTTPGCSLDAGHQSATPGTRCTTMGEWYGEVLRPATRRCVSMGAKEDRMENGDGKL